jgi:hypothetical protein
MNLENFEGNEYMIVGEDNEGRKTLINNEEIVLVNKGRRIPNLSLLQNPTLVFDNTIGADDSSVNMPIIHNEHVIGIITEVGNDKIYCKIWDRCIGFYPEYNSPDGIKPFKLCGINISIAKY